jgi:hypothetical protein
MLSSVKYLEEIIVRSHLHDGVRVSRNLSDDSHQTTRPHHASIFASDSITFAGDQLGPLDRSFHTDNADGDGALAL